MKAAGKCPKTHCQPIGEEAELPSGSWQKQGNFHPFSLRHCVFRLHLLKVAGAVENLKNAQ
jgi:hypothetical protein